MGVGEQVPNREFCTEAIEMPKPIRLAQGARRKPVNFLRLFVFFNLA